MKTITLCLLALAGLLIGCSTVRVPANTIRFKTPYGSLDVTHPQDFTGTNMYVMIETNGTVTASFGYIKTANSPAVIDKVAAGQVAIIRAQGEVSEKLFKAGIDAGADAAKKTVVP